MGPNPFIPFNNDFLRYEDNFMANHEFFTENRNENFRHNVNVRRNENFRQLSYMLFTPTLENLKNVLYTGLNPFFEEFEIAVVSCLNLTRAPYNLAAAGLSGNTGILQMGSIKNFHPIPRTNFVFDILCTLSRCNYDAFVIGSGFAAKPLMSYNGHLTMNAVVSPNHRNVINNSCIAYEDTDTDQRRLEIINDFNQIRCSIFGNFFFSEGLGIVLVINGGRTGHVILPDNYVDYGYHRDMVYYGQISDYVSNCTTLIALRALINDKLMFFKDSYGCLFDTNYKFNTFSNYESAGEFLDVDTPEETEYIVYLNIAQEVYKVINF